MIYRVRRFLPDGTDCDVIGLVEDQLEAAVQVFYIRGGRIRGQRGWVVDKVEDVTAGDLVGQFLSQVYSGDSVASGQVAGAGPGGSPGRVRRGDSGGPLAHRPRPGPARKGGPGTQERTTKHRRYPGRGAGRSGRGHAPAEHHQDRRRQHGVGAAALPGRGAAFAGRASAPAPRFFRRNPSLLPFSTTAPLKPATRSRICRLAHRRTGGLQAGGDQPCQLASVFPRSM